MKIFFLKKKSDLSEKDEKGAHIDQNRKQEGQGYSMRKQSGKSKVERKY